MASASGGLKRDLARRSTVAGQVETDPQNAEFRIVDWPFFSVVQLAGRYHLKLDAVLKPIGMDVARWRVLMIASTREFATVTEIADIAVTRMSTMAKIVQRMVSQDLVSTSPSANDARAIEVRITEHGQAVLGQIRAKVSRLSHQAFDGVSKKDLHTLNVITRQIHDNLLP